MLVIKDLLFRFSRKTPPLFEHLDCELTPGSIVGLLGKNGAGKTTLLKIITGLLHPTAGTVRVLDHVPSYREPSLLQDVYFLPEEFYHPAVSIEKYVRANAGFYPRFNETVLRRLIGEFELPEGKNLQQLSYGQKKKFLISFALSTGCRLLVLDEPTNGLDIPSKSIFRRVMAGALQEDQLVIISTHQVRDVENLIDQILMLDRGKFIMQKSIYDIASQLRFTTTTSLDADRTLYHESFPGGYKVILPQVNGDSSVDIELLFNAVSNGSEKMKAYVR